MTAQAARVHRIRPNHREWTPPQFISLDTETLPESTPEGELHSLRCWAARLDVRRSSQPGGTGISRGYGFDTDELADQFDIWTAGQRTVWMYAHNLSFDLAVTRLPAVLAGRGWAVTDHAVTSDAPWLRMKRRDCVITMCDSWGWLRAELADIAEDIDWVKPDLPDWGDSDKAWLGRCQADTDILATAMGQLMDWWDDQQLGSWTLTGSSGGWNTWRHRATVELPLIVPDPEQTAADRRAIYGGRREAFRHGTLQGGPWVLADFRSAYPTIAASHPLPAARQGNFDSQPVDSPLVCGDGYGIIAEVELDTATPRYPVRVNGRVAYPVGRFRTVLAGPEIAEARRLGHLVAIGPGWLHKLSPHMRDWARWVLDVTDGTDTSVPRVVRRAVKHWGRATIGKSAAHGWRITPLATLGGGGWDYRPAWNQELAAPSHLVEICGKACEVTQSGDGDNAYPAILAWVESWTRVYLSRAIDQLGRVNIATCDTDGLIVDWRRWAQLGAATIQVGPLELRRKATYEHVQIIGPQHLITDADRKLSGIPRSARANTDGSLTAMLWPRLSTQMQLRPGSTEAGYLRPSQTYTLAESYVTGWVCVDGDVDPLQAAVCQSGHTHLLPLDTELQVHFPPDRQATHLRSMITPITEGTPECTYHTSRSNGTAGASAQSGQSTSCTSTPNRGRRRAAKHRTWRRSGGRIGMTVRRAFSGRTRTSSPTPETSRR